MFNEVKITTVILSLFLILPFVPNTSAQEAKPQIKVEISTFKDSSNNYDLIETNCFEVGDRVNVYVKITNLSDQKTGVPMGIDFSRPTLFRNGELVSFLKGVGEKWAKYPGGTVRGIISLKPNEAKTEIVELGDAYKSLEVGEYQLSVEKRLFKGRNFFSNTITFKVISVCSKSQK